MGMLVSHAAACSSVAVHGLFFGHLIQCADCLWDAIWSQCGEAVKNDRITSPLSWTLVMIYMHPLTPSNALQFAPTGIKPKKKYNGDRFEKWLNTFLYDKELWHEVICKNNFFQIPNVHNFIRSMCATFSTKAINILHNYPSSQPT